MVEDETVDFSFVRDNGPFLCRRIALSDIGNQLRNLLSPFDCKQQE
jgi:hypothetical protein